MDDEPQMPSLEELKNDSRIVNVWLPDDEITEDLTSVIVQIKAYCTSPHEDGPVSRYERLSLLESYQCAITRFADAERDLLKKWEESGRSQESRLIQLITVFELFSSAKRVNSPDFSFKNEYSRKSLLDRLSIIIDALHRIAELAGYQQSVLEAFQPTPGSTIQDYLLSDSATLPVIPARQFPPLKCFLQANDVVANAIRKTPIIDGGLHNLKVSDNLILPVTIKTVAGSYAELYPEGRLTGEERLLLDAVFSLYQERGLQSPITFNAIISAMHGGTEQHRDAETVAYLWKIFEKFSVTHIWLNVSQEQTIYSLDGLASDVLMRGVPLLDFDPIIARYDNGGGLSAGIILKSPPIIGAHAMAKRQIITTQVPALQIHERITKQGKKSNPVRMETWRQVLRLFLARRISTSQNADKKARKTKKGKDLLKKTGQALEAYQRTISADELLTEYVEVKTLSESVESVSRHARRNVMEYVATVLDNLEHDEAIRGYVVNKGTRNRITGFTVEF